MQKRNLLIIILFLFTGTIGWSAERIRQNFDFDWQFRLGEQGIYKPVQLPHDWSIELDFNEEVGPESGYLPGGIGYYKKDFNVPASYKGKRVSIVFDGIYHKATIYLNGQEVDYHRYGYTSFETDLTPYLKYGGKNTLSVKVDHSEKSRWYTGSGIYRHVWMQVTNPIHVKMWGTYITTPRVSAESAIVSCVTTVANTSALTGEIEIMQRIVDAQGNLLHNENIYPHPPINKTGEAASKLRKMIEAYQIEVISIGNGTASRETEDFINSQSFDRQIPVFVVSEQGASIYSASKIARDEFPDYDVTVRGAVSIGRRLMDPLAELVKIDPKSIGVGQYQHDVDQTKLKKALDQTVENCVNLVGVNLNTASSHLLTYISGLGPQLAQNIVNYRAENGAFDSRKALMKVPRMGAKAFEQCAGFLRIPGAKNPLDNTAVHPESYHIVEQMAKDLKCTVNELIANKELRQKIKISDYITPTVGLPTLQDIMQELDKPGRDPRKAIKVFEFDKNVRTIADLREGMILPGIVGNITNFGAFVDIGIKENGLVHLSQLAERFISDPTEVVSIHQHVMVRVMNVDYDRKRIQLSMIGVQQD